MLDTARNERLEAEHLRLAALAQDSTIFSLEPTGDPPTKYILSFRGGGVSRSLSSRAKVEVVDLHQIEMRIPYAFPQRPPDVRWLTPIYHPNVSFSGLVKLRDIGLPWEEDMSLDVVCERLWDVARMAYFDDERSSNYAARTWLADQQEINLPVDTRPLRDKSQPSSSNIIRYRRRQAGAMRMRTPQDEPDVFYIGEETPTPQIPTASVVPEEEVFFIGE